MSLPPFLMRLDADFLAFSSINVPYFIPDFHKASGSYYFHLGRGELLSNYFSQNSAFTSTAPLTCAVSDFVSSRRRSVSGGLVS